MPNIVFVLLLNREQLEKSIQGVYGSETDASRYLSKFVNFFFTLPKQYDVHNSKELFNRFISRVMERYSFNTYEMINADFMNCFSTTAVHFNLSLRDIERGIALYAFAHPVNVYFYDFLVYAITLKISKPALFKDLLKNNIEAHKEAKILLQQSSDTSVYLDTFSEFHAAHASNFVEIGENFGETLSYIRGTGISRDQIFITIAKCIDLPMEI